MRPDREFDQTISRKSNQQAEARCANKHNTLIITIAIHSLPSLLPIFNILRSSSNMK